MEFTLDQVKDLITAGVKEGLEGFKKELQPAQSIVEKLLRTEGVEFNEASEKGFVTARIVRAIAAGKMHGVRPFDWAVKAYGERSAAVKALAASDPLAGGTFVPPGYRAEFIEFLRPASVVRSLTPTIWPMPNGTAQVPMLTGGSTAAYVGENQNVSATAVTTGMLNLSAKKLAAIVPISNDLIRYSSPAADTVVRDDLVSAIAQREDLAFIRGTGLSDTPKGLKNWVSSANSIPTAGTSLANVTTDLGNLRLALRTANVRFLRPAWVMSPRSENYLMTIRDGNGNYAFRPEMLTGKLWGYPFGVTSQIPENLGSGHETEVYFADFADVVIGESEQLMIDTSMEAAYYDGSAVVAAFSKDQTVIRAIEAHDFGMRHIASVSLLTAVTWGY